MQTSAAILREFNLTPDTGLTAAQAAGQTEIAEILKRRSNLK